MRLLINQSRVAEAISFAEPMVNFKPSYMSRSRSLSTQISGASDQA